MPAPRLPGTRAGGGEGRRARLRALGLAIACLAAAGCADGTEARLTATPAVLDFGTVVYGESRMGRVTLRNDSDRAVFVTSVTANCSCFEVHSYRSRLRPGEETEIRVTLHAAPPVPPDRLRGKRLEVLSDDPAAPRIQVALEGAIVSPRTVRPGHLDLGLLDGARRSQAERVEVRAGAGMTIRYVAHRVEPAGLFATALEEAEGGFDIVLHLEEEAGGPGVLSAVLHVALEAWGPDVPRRRIDDEVRILGEWPP